MDSQVVVSGSAACDSGQQAGKQAGQRAGQPKGRLGLAAFLLAGGSVLRGLVGWRPWTGDKYLAGVVLRRGYIHRVQVTRPPKQGTSTAPSSRQWQVTDGLYFSCSNRAKKKKEK